MVKRFYALVQPLSVWLNCHPLEMTAAGGSRPEKNHGRNKGSEPEVVRSN